MATISQEYVVQAICEDITAYSGRLVWCSLPPAVRCKGRLPPPKEWKRHSAACKKHELNL
eukprot:1093558-Amphidinium_carterae.1